ncbi:MAG TPA: condensation domain-containing protein, partial [Solirubrobacteraceae bacterium]
MGIELPLRALFETPAVKDLAERVKTAEPVALPPMTAVPREGALPLSYSQERLWFLDQLGLVGSAYNMPTAVRLVGRLDVAALAGALSEVVRRHEALRTRIEGHEGSGVQVIDPPWRVELAALACDAGEARQRARATMERPFDLANDRLLRVELLRLGAQDHVLVLVMHHIVSDGWSMEVLVREIGALYAAFVQGQVARLPELSIQYADYALWQRRVLSGEAPRQLGYWTKQLAGAPALADLGRREDATLFMVLLAAFDVLLGRWSGQDDVVVGTPIAGRTRAETEELIGFFVNTLALRSDLSDDPAFATLLRRVKETALAAYGHQDLPFEKLVEALQPVRDLSRQPIFQVMFALQNVPHRTTPMRGLSVEPFGEEVASAKFDLQLTMMEASGELWARFDYATDLFEASTIERLADHFERLLDGIVSAPSRRVSELALLGEAERRQLVSGWNDTAVAYPQHCLHDLFAAQAARTPDAVAVTYDDVALSYGELEARANQLAHYLRRRGVGAETVVGLCAERSLEMVIGLLGVLKAGGAYLPLDPGYPAERLAYMLADAGAPVLLTQAALIERLPAHDAQVIRLDAD